MTCNALRALSRTAFLALMGLSLAGAPSWAEKGGNGGGNGNGGGAGNGGTHGNSRTHGPSGIQGKSSTAPGRIKTAAVTQEAGIASRYGRLNGFLHASPAAIAKASAKSAIGKVAIVYAGLLNAYLAPAAGTTPPTAAEVAAALKAASNKPLTADVIAAVNAKLIAVNTELSTNLTASGKTAGELADEIAAAL
jgi:hypothetical protein